MASNPASTTTAVYQPLTHDREIRLLELLPGIADETVECILSHVTLGTNAYEAISYAWSGPPTAIVCNGHTFFTTKNLRDALVQLRSSTVTRLLWTDQICINQNDEYEKDMVQIPLMRDIYFYASQVLIWLGCAQDDSDFAMDCFYEMVTDLSNPTPEGKQRLQVLDQRHSRGTRALNHLLRRNWFTRVWTLQEVAVAKQAIILCGEKQLDWKWVQLFNDKCQSETDRGWTSLLGAISSGTDRKTGEMGRYLTANIHAISRLKASQPGTTDVKHLHRVRSCGVTRPKDKVLALLHYLSEDLRKRLLQLNNGIGYDTETFYQVVAAFELSKLNTNFLGAAGLAQRTCSSLPTWVPDWTTPESTHDLWLLNSLKLENSNTGLYNASSGDAFVKVDDRYLHVKAKLIDDINLVAEKPQFSITADVATCEPDDTVGIMECTIFCFAQRRRYIERCMKLAEPCKMRYEPLNSACYQTLTRGIIQEGESSTAGGTQRRATGTEWDALFEHYFQNMQMTESPRFIDAWRELVHQQKTSSNAQTADSMDLKPLAEFPRFMKVIEHVQDSFKGRTFFTTTSGYMGLGACNLDTARIGDQIAVVNGCCTPFVIRPVPKQNSFYELVGEAYVHGLMDGEAAAMQDIKEVMLTLQ